MKALRRGFLCSNFKEYAIPSKAFSFWLAFLQRDLTSGSNVSLLSKWIPRSFSHLLFEMVIQPMLIWVSCDEFVLRMLFIVLLSSSIPVLPVMLFAHVGKRSNSRSQMLLKTGVLINFAVFTGKNLCRSLFLIKFQDWKPEFLFEKGHQHKCFPVNIAKFSRTIFL